MTFNPAIPQPNDDMSESQGDLLINMGELNTVFGEDHEPFTASVNKGKHKKVTFTSQGNDPDTDAPSTKENEMALFALEDGTNTELYARRENNGDVFQVTKGNELFVAIHPEFAINISDLTPNAVVTPGLYNFTVNNSFNLDTANSARVTASKCHYKFAFTNTILDANGSPTNKYLFTANGFDNSSNPLIGKVPNTSNYDTKVDPDFIEIEFVNQNNTQLSSLTGASILVWRVQ